jgi:hypothetical protein
VNRQADCGGVSRSHGEGYGNNSAIQKEIEAGANDRDGMVFLYTDCREYWRFRKDEALTWGSVSYRPLGYV